VAFLYPWADYDAVRYEVVLHIEGSGRLILPVPEEEGLIKDLMASPRNWSLVETDRGTGLQINLSSGMSIAREYLTRDHKIDYSPDLMVGDYFFFFFDPSEANGTVRLEEFRILHQSPWDFHSKQCFQKTLASGWTSARYEVSY